MTVRSTTKTLSQRVLKRTPLPLYQKDQAFDDSSLSFMGYSSLALIHTQKDIIE